MEKKKKSIKSAEIEALLERCKQVETEWVEHKKKMEELENELDQDYERIEKSLNEIREEIEELKKKRE